MVIFDSMRWQLPAAMQLVVVMLLHASFFQPDQTVDFVEMFSGQGELSQALRDAGFSGSSHDTEISSKMDLTTTSGFLILGLSLESFFNREY